MRGSLLSSTPHRHRHRHRHPHRHPHPHHHHHHHHHPSYLAKVPSHQLSSTLPSLKSQFLSKSKLMLCAHVCSPRVLSGAEVTNHIAEIWQFCTLVLSQPFHGAFSHSVTVNGFGHGTMREHALRALERRGVLTDCIK